MSRKSDRRTFLKTTAAVGAGFWVAGGVQAEESKSANEEISFGCIGVGGKGTSDSADAGKNGNVIAICDIDENTLNRAAARFPKAKKYTDYRKMIDEMGKSLDGVTVSTPDHSHAPAAIRAMNEGLACFCQKPMTHTLQEARLMGELAAKKNLATQMGNQGTAGAPLREAAALIKAGVLGNLKEVHVWTNRPVWPQGLDRPEGKPVPEYVHWDNWIGPAQERPYSPAYHPFKWRGFWEFGTGALGDMACHTLNMPFMGAELQHPLAVQATSAGHNKETYPKWSQIKFEFGPGESRGPINFTWYDGGKRPPAELLEGRTYKNKPATAYASGAWVIGDKGSIFSGDDYCGAFELWDVDKVDVDFPKSPGHFEEYARAIKTNNAEPAMSNFPNYASPLTETVLLGNLAIWAAADADTPGKRIEWDAKNQKATNAPEVDEIIRKKYRDGWAL
ncbi:Gfo/Idh/MocA family protein [Lignipirellula cremea]|uniref:Glucose-6-phosphate 3-dehydrogenase n=1 Tax=Lignipirellula cremea TaxID=2528010 RepID=A0A518DNB3_9BACT|nr:Gfo/Idh/MocA family oxidoreductase [Lignipirellula cremea]QDU93327.1 Glucose-6-phosphate 3-dehydrogenase [Lignipirellula cremea]